MAGNKKWFVLRVISGKERKLREYINLEVSRSGWTELVTQVLVPTEKVYKVKNGKKVIHEKNFFPGYIMIEAEEDKLRGEVVQKIRSINGVINFLGTKTGDPIPLRQSEVNRILGKVDDAEEAGMGMNEPFIKGETVKIIDGPFNDFTGNIEEVNEEKKKLKVIVKIFGRKTPVELSLIHI